MWWMLLVIAIATLLAVKLIQRLESATHGTGVLNTHNSNAGSSGQADTHKPITQSESIPRQPLPLQSPSIPIENSLV
jgi:hypothetical protein